MKVFALLDGERALVAYTTRAVARRHRALDPRGWLKVVPLEVLETMDPGVRHDLREQPEAWVVGLAWEIGENGTQPTDETLAAEARRRGADRRLVNFRRLAGLTRQAKILRERELNEGRG